MEQNYLTSISKIYKYYEQLGKNAIDQCSDEGLFISPNQSSNSIAVIVKHIHGNMLSRWTDFLTSDGEKDWRDRDGEFEQTITTRAMLVKKYDEGWTCLFNAIDALNSEDVFKIIYIRNQGHTVLEAINRQLAHIPYHIGQIVYLSRMYSQAEWQSLSIPKGASKAFNENHFKEEKSMKHFTDEFLNKNLKG